MQQFGEHSYTLKIWNWLPFQKIKNKVFTQTDNSKMVPSFSTGWETGL